VVDIFPDTEDREDYAGIGNLMVVIDGLVVSTYGTGTYGSGTFGDPDSIGKVYGTDTYGSGTFGDPGSGLSLLSDQQDVVYIDGPYRAPSQYTSGGRP
jgi:hypothetical protein